MPMLQVKHELNLIFGVSTSFYSVEEATQRGIPASWLDTGRYTHFIPVTSGRPHEKIFHGPIEHFITGPLHNRSLQPLPAKHTQLLEPHSVDPQLDLAVNVTPTSPRETPSYWNHIQSDP
jgi:hypothetical protein